MSAGWRARVSPVPALNAACTLLLACGGGGGGGGASEPQADVELWPIPSSGIPFDRAVGGAGGSSAPLGDGGRGQPPPDPPDPEAPIDEEDAGPPMEPDPTLALFDPQAVYVFGMLTRSQSNTRAVAPALAAGEALAGFGSYARPSPAFVRPSDGRLIYWDINPDAVFAFHCDGCVYARRGDMYPRDPKANDEVLSSAACEGLTVGAHMSDFKLTADEEIVIRCGDQRWYDTSGVELTGLVGNVLSVGHQGTALLPNGVLEIATGVHAPLTGPEDFTVLTARALEDGYWIATRATDPNIPPELWRVAFDGTGTLQGTYPAVPEGQLVTLGSALDGTGRLFQLAATDDALRETIIRRSVDGESDVVYDEADALRVTLYPDGLFTGP